MFVISAESCELYFFFFSSKIWVWSSIVCFEFSVCVVGGIFFHKIHKKYIYCNTCCVLMCMKYIPYTPSSKELWYVFWCWKFGKRTVKEWMLEQAVDLNRVIGKEQHSFLPYFRLVTHVSERDNWKNSCRHCNEQLKWISDALKMHAQRNIAVNDECSSHHIYIYIYIPRNYELFHIKVNEIWKMQSFIRLVAIILEVAFIICDKKKYHL